MDRTFHADCHLTEMLTNGFLTDAVKEKLEKHTRVPSEIHAVAECDHLHFAFTSIHATELPTFSNNVSAWLITMRTPRVSRFCYTHCIAYLHTIARLLQISNKCARRRQHGLLQWLYHEAGMELWWARLDLHYNRCILDNHLDYWYDLLHIEKTSSLLTNSQCASYRQRCRCASCLLGALLACIRPARLLPMRHRILDNEHLSTSWYSTLPSLQYTTPAHRHTTKEIHREDKPSQRRSSPATRERMAEVGDTPRGWKSKEEVYDIHRIWNGGSGKVNHARMLPID